MPDYCVLPCVDIYWQKFTMTASSNKAIILWTLLSLHLLFLSFWTLSPLSLPQTLMSCGQCFLAFMHHAPYDTHALLGH